MAAFQEKYMPYLAINTVFTINYPSLKTMGKVQVFKDTWQ